MKRIKRLWTILCAAALASFGCLFAACGKSDVNGAKLLENSKTLVVIEATETGGSLFDAMAKLKEEGSISFEGSEGQYGFYLTSVNGTQQAADYSSYWAVYTSLGDYEGIAYSNAEYGAYPYNNQSYASASYGVSGLPMAEGNCYLLVFVS